MVYLDPDTGDLIDTWTNEAGQEVPVMDVANSPATFPLGPLGSSYDVLIGGETATYEFDVPLSYPNPAYFNPQTQPYAPYQNYTANEFFKWNIAAKDLDDGTSTGGLRKGTYDDSIKEVTVAWTRQSPYLPWMNMTQAQKEGGFLLLSATATKVGSYDDLFPVLKSVVEERAPIYKTAPDCVFQNTRPSPAWLSTTSWSYFVQNFDSYLEGKTFPLPETDDGKVCVGDNI